MWQQWCVNSCAIKMLFEREFPEAVKKVLANDVLRQLEEHLSSEERPLQQASINVEIFFPTDHRNYMPCFIVQVMRAGNAPLQPVEAHELRGLEVSLPRQFTCRLNVDFSS